METAVRWMGCVSVFVGHHLPQVMVRTCFVSLFFFSSRRRHTRWPRDWSSDVCSSDLNLTPDFSGKPDLLQEVFEARPEVFAHNVETVPRIFKRIRPAFRYERSLDVLQQAHDFGLITKSNLILGMGETAEEIEEALRDLRSVGTDIITITQYLRPGPRFHPIERWVRPEEFIAHSELAKELGFTVMSGPLVRSSYRAGKLYTQAMKARGWELPENLKHLEETSDGATAQEASSLLQKYGPSEETPVTSRMG